MKSEKLFCSALLCILICTTCYLPLKAGDPKVSFKLGKGLTIADADSTVSLNISVAMQMRLDVLKLFDKDFKPQTTAQVRRLRLTMHGFAFTPKLEYMIQLGFSPADIKSGIVHDGFLKYTPVKQFAIQFGEAKLPGNREDMTGDASIQFVDRTTTSNLFKLDRDFALQLFGKLGNKVVFKPTASMSTGEGRNFVNASWQHFDYTFRVELEPLGEFSNRGDYASGDLARETSPKLALAASFDYNNKAGLSNGQLGGNAVPDSLRRNVETGFIDMIFKYNGMCLAGEYANRWVKDNTIYQAGQSFWASASYDFKKNLEPAFRFTRTFSGKWGNVDTMNEYTLALSKYFYGQALKIQTDYTFIDDKTIHKKSGLWRFQIQIVV
jgi:hypothetical protein